MKTGSGNLLITNVVNTDLDYDKLTREEHESMFQYLNSVVFIQNLISPDRRYCKDMPRYTMPDVKEEDLEEDPNGRVRIDFSDPHILEDMDYFQQTGLYFQKHGVYTHLMPSRNPYSDYVKFWNQEIERCWNGMTRASDGEWVTGYHYFYLNYSFIKQSKVIKGTGRADRTYDLPLIYDGDYWFFHYLERARTQGKHTTTLKKRGAGYSYKASSKLARNFIMGESKIANTGSSSFAIANEKEYLTKDGILNKFVDIIDFVGDRTPFPRRRELKDSLNAMHWKMGYKDPETDLEKGTKNEVIGVTLKGDYEKARGKRGVLIEWEEFGKFKDSLKAWNIGRPSVEEDGFGFGLMNSYGTGGTEGAQFEGLRKMFYYPAAYNVLPLENVFDKNTKPGATCAFFHGAYLNAKGHFDKDGNSDVISALLYIVKDRIDLKFSSPDTQALAQRIAEYPLVPQEAIMEIAGNIFPKLELMDYIEDSRVNINDFVSDILVGDLVLQTNASVEFKINLDREPIRGYGKTTRNPYGAIEIFRVPEENPSSYRYIAGIDPIDNDYIETGSLGSIFVFDTYTDQIVAEYTGRPDLAEDFYEICRRLLLYYNAQGLYESNIKGMFGYFQNKNCLHLLADTPEYLRDQQQIKAAIFGNRAKGVRVNEAIKNEGNRLQKSWMLAPHFYTDHEGEEKETIKLRTIKSLGYLAEAYEYNSEGNFDRVSAMTMVMILRKDRHLLIQAEKETEDFYIEEDPFIANNFDSKYNLEEEGTGSDDTIFKELI